MEQHGDTPLGNRYPRQEQTEVLTPREVEILRLLETSLSHQEIATLLHTSLETVRRRTEDIYRKLTTRPRHPPDSPRASAWGS